MNLNAFNNLPRALCVGLVCAIALSLAPANAPATDPGPVTVFRDVRLFDGERSIPAADVVVRGTRIELVAAADEALEIPDGSALIDGSGLTLMPGLIDAHTHTFSRSMLERSLDFGVTTCVDMWTSVAFMQEMQAERVDGIAYDRADYLSSGIGATAPDSHGTQFGPVPTLTAPDEADAFVAARLAEGSDYIKIIYDNFKMFDRPVPTLDYATLDAVVDAAHRRNKLAVAHSRDVDAYADVARAGGDGLVHAPVDEIPDEELVATLRDQGMFVIPTLSVSTPSGTGVAEDPVLGPRLSEKELESLRKYTPRHRPGGDQVSMDAVKALHEGGVTILAGSDSPNRGTATGVSIHQELEMLVQAGLTPAEALVAATSAPADVFGLTHRGRIRPGHRADLLLVAGDPTSTITDSRKIVGVWKAGRRHAAEP